MGTKEIYSSISVRLLEINLHLKQRILCDPVTGPVCRVTALLFHDRGTRRGWMVSNTPRPHFTPGQDPVLILQEAERAPGPVWTGGKSRPHRDSIPDRPVSSQSKQTIGQNKIWSNFTFSYGSFIALTLKIRNVGNLTYKPCTFHQSDTEQAVFSAIWFSGNGLSTSTPIRLMQFLCRTCTINHHSTFPFFKSQAWHQKTFLLKLMALILPHSQLT